MATVTGGDLLSLSWQHPELGSLTFSPKTGEDVNIAIGGFFSVDDDGNITSNGKRINIMNRKPWSLEGTLGAEFDELDALQQQTGNVQEAKWLATLMNGQTLTGSGHVVGDLMLNHQAGTITLKIQGSGTLELI